jgi:hypothetical protein
LAGGSVTVKGCAGHLNPVTLIPDEEIFVKVMGIVTSLPPMRAGAKAALVGEMVNDAVAVSPWPLRLIWDVAPEMFAVSVPGFAPRAVGVNVTGTVIDCPVDNEAGNVRLGDPIVYPAPASMKEVTVVGAVAVNVAFSVSDCETVVAGKFTSAPLRAGVDEASAPKPRSVSSFVPTYTTPLSTPGSENTVDVKVDELQTSSSELLTGIGLKASNWESCPLGPAA